MSEEGDTLIAEGAERLASNLEPFQTLARDIDHWFVGQMAQIEPGIAPSTEKLEQLVRRSERSLQQARWTGEAAERLRMVRLGTMLMVEPRLEETVEEQETEDDVHFVFSRHHALNQEEWVARTWKYAYWVPYLDGEPPLYKMLVEPPAVLLAWWNWKSSPRRCFHLGSSLMLGLEDREARRRDPDSIADLETEWEILYKHDLPALARNKDPAQNS
jgi:hypothetical protein